MPNNCLDADSEQPFELYLIDLHRALIKNPLALRWIVKDVSGLFYSAMEIGLTQRDCYRFMKTYDGTSLRDALVDNGAFWSSVDKRARAMHRKLGSVT